MAGDDIGRAQRLIGRPLPGYWAVRLRSRAVEVGARIYWHQTTHEPGEAQNEMERSRILSAEINGERVNPQDLWERRGRAISEAEYRYLIADRAWAATYAPTDPAADPAQPVNLATAKPPF
jgi:hypothetical protein